jgi:hypothetical protein
MPHSPERSWTSIIELIDREADFQMRSIKKAVSHRGPRKGRPAKSRARTENRYWSARVMRDSDALDLKKGALKLNDPAKIADSLKRSAEQSDRRKAEPYRSASPR